MTFLAEMKLYQTPLSRAQEYSLDTYGICIITVTDGDALVGDDIGISRQNGIYETVHIISMQDRTTGRFWKKVISDCVITKNILSAAA